MAEQPKVLTVDSLHPQWVALRYNASALLEFVAPDKIVGGPLALGQKIYLYRDGSFRTELAKES